MPSIVNALLIHERLVLLARRGQHRRAYAGLWSFPGGHVEVGETLGQALVREMREEIRLVPTSYRWLAAVPDPTAATTTYEMHLVTSWEGGEPTMLGDEHSELGWFQVEAAMALPDLALDAYRPLLAKLRG